MIHFNKKFAGWTAIMATAIFAFAPSMAFAADTLASNILATTITWCGAIVMIVMVVLLVKDVIGVVKGDKNIGAVLIKFFSILIILGLMYAASGFDTFGTMFSGVINKTVVDTNLPDITGSAGK